MKRLTIVVDNYPFVEGLKTDWGFSALLEMDGFKILFDLGNEPSIFEHNVRALGIDLSKIDCVFVSHYDSDHTGGLEVFLRENENAPVIFPENPAYRSLNEKLSRSREVITVEEPSSVCDTSLGIFSTGTVEPSPRPEHSLYFKTDEGWIVIAGCSHPKVWNIAKRVKELTGEDVALYIGGYHFYRLKGKELEEAVKKVKESGIRKVAPCHCTGDTARRMLKELYDENFVDVGVGKVLEWS